MKPVIGILYCGFLTQGFERQSIYVTSSYLSAVEVSGGLPVVIPYFSDLNCIANYIKLFDGILFCGGDDVTPLLYHEELGTNRGHTDYKTDTFHFTFMKEALRSRLPILGICLRYAGTKSGTWRNHLSRPLPSAAAYVKPYAIIRKPQ